MREITSEEMLLVSGGESLLKKIGEWLDAAGDGIANFIGMDGQFGYQDHSGNGVEASIYVTASVAPEGVGPMAQVTLPVNGTGTASVGAGVGSTGVSFSNSAVTGLDVGYGGASYNVALDASGGHDTFGPHQDGSDVYSVDIGVLPGSTPYGPKP